MDNLSSHKGSPVRELIKAAGASLRYLPPYNPGFNPIQNAFAKLKALLRKTAARRADALWAAIADQGAVLAFKPRKVASSRGL